jgi:AraC-like DNA-binding protein
LNVSADELSAAAHTSYSHLSTLFRAAFGCGPMRFHLNHRMERAETLLQNPYISVGEVAAQLGFDDANYFVRLFRQTHGLSPNRWRKAVAAAENRGTPGTAH